jgi:hypothetical protein
MPTPFDSSGIFPRLAPTTGLFTNWKAHQMIDTASSVTLGLGLLAVCIGILLIDNYLLFKAFAVMGIALISAYGVAWIVQLRPAL